MAVEHITVPVLIFGKGEAGTVKAKSKFVDISAGASANSTYFFYRVPSNARILGNTSRLEASNPALNTGGASTISVGIFAVDGNITDDDDALRPDFTVNGIFSTSLINNATDYGKQLWEYVSGQTKDPGGDLDIKVTLKSNVDTGGRFDSTLSYTL